VIDSTYRSKLDFFGWLIGGVVLTGILTTLLYSPILKYSGVDALFHNSFVKPLSMAEFSDLLPGRIVETWQIWQNGAGLLLWLLFIGFLISLILYRSSNNHGIPAQAGLLWIPIIVLFLRPNPWPKIWSAMLPLFVIWGSAGWLVLARVWVKQKYLAIFAISIAIVVLLTGAVRDIPKVFQLPGEPGEIEKAILAISSLFEPGDTLLVASPNDAPAWYYARIHGIPMEAFSHLEERNIQKAFVLVNPDLGQTLESVLQDRKIDPDLFDFASANIILDWDTLQVIEISARPSQ
jgi:hypothetical protein